MMRTIVHWESIKVNVGKANQNAGFRYARVLLPDVVIKSNECHER